MLYLFTGNSEYLIKEQVKVWKDRFVGKFGDFNMVHLKDINTADNNFLTENISSASFLSEKKLVIIDIDKELKSEKEEFLLKVLNKIPDDNIILLNSISPDKRSKFHKKLLKICDLKEFNTKDESDIRNVISTRYKGKISNSAISGIIKYKSNNLTKIISEIEKLLITYDFIDTKEVTENIVPELEESIFQVIDDILNKNTTEVINKLDIILNDTNIYALYNNLLANLRTSIYILKLKTFDKIPEEISATLNLGARKFLINKRYKISSNEAQKLYINLVKIDKKMKSGKLLGTEDIDFKYELERVLLG